MTRDQLDQWLTVLALAIAGVVAIGGFWSWARRDWAKRRDAALALEHHSWGRDVGPAFDQMHRQLSAAEKGRIEAAQRWSDVAAKRGGK